ncbi:MAG: DUF7839 domain-containing protein [Methanoculleaceae archaeon]
MRERIEDPLYTILRSKRDATRFQIMVEIAEHQPAIRQQEIAEKLGVTPQAVSEYIRDLVDSGMVTAHGRGHYEVTKVGVEWILQHAGALEAYARHITKDIIQQVAVWTAVAAEEIRKGQTVGVYMKDGWLYASSVPTGAMGTALMDAREGEDVGIASLSGIIDHKEGTVHVCKVPRVERGGSRNVDQELLKEVLQDVDVAAAVGIEAWIALQRAGRRPDMFFGAREGVVEAAFHGLNCAILIVDEEFTDFLTRLESVGLHYVVHDLVSP